MCHENVTRANEINISDLSATGGICVPWWNLALFHSV